MAGVAASITFVTGSPPVDAATFAREIARGRAVRAGEPLGRGAPRCERRSRDDVLSRALRRRPALDAMIGAPAIEGRFFYDETLSGFNFTRQLVALG
jgi:hypothetical protein